MLLDLAWDIVRVYPKPTKRGHAFLAPVVEHPIFFTQQCTYMNDDNDYLDLKILTLKWESQYAKKHKPYTIRNSFTIVRQKSSPLAERWIFVNLVFTKSKT